MSRKLKLLLVEDNADLRRLYAIGLNQHGFEVKLASNGAEALDRLEAEAPNLILLDVMMPVMDGWEVLTRVQGGERDVAVIVVSGTEKPAEEQLPPCVIAWLSKPVSIDEVVAAIHNAEAIRGGR